VSVNVFLTRFSSSRRTMLTPAIVEVINVNPPRGHLRGECGQGVLETQQVPVSWAARCVGRQMRTTRSGWQQSQVKRPGFCGSNSCEVRRAASSKAEIHQIKDSIPDFRRMRSNDQWYDRQLVEGDRPG
jgi:hypothetical protein